jgi:hypothetical protein
MSSLIATPELINTAATDLANIGSDLNAAHAAAAAPTTGVIPAAADEVSAGIARLFSRYAGSYHALAAQAAAFHQQFMQNLTASAHSYAGAEAANAGSMGGAVSRMGALLNALGHIPPGQFMHTPFLPGTGIKNPFFGVPPGHVMHTPFIPGTGIKNPLFGVPPGHWNISQLIQALNTNNGAAAIHQPFMQPLHPKAASDIQGQNQQGWNQQGWNPIDELFFPIDDLFFFIFKFLEDIPQELLTLITLLILF